MNIRSINEKLKQLLDETNWQLADTDEDQLEYEDIEDTKYKYFSAKDKITGEKLAIKARNAEEAYKIGKNVTLDTIYSNKNLIPKNYVIIEKAIKNNKKLEIAINENNVQEGLINKCKQRLKKISTYEIVCKVDNDKLLLVLPGNAMSAARKFYIYDGTTNDIIQFNKPKELITLLKDEVYEKVKNVV